MTLRQIMEHKRNGLTVKVAGQDAKIIKVDEPNSKVTVQFFDGMSMTVSFYDVKTEWAGEWTPPAPSAPEATMIAIEKHPKMEAAISRAKAIRPRVTFVNADARIYSVMGSKGNRYTVRFVVVGTKKLAECNCKAGQASMLCLHIAAAAQANVMTQSMRRQGASAPAVPVLPAKNADARRASHPPANAAPFARTQTREFFLWQ